MKKHLARIVLDIEDLVGFNLKLDKAQNPCKIGLSDVGGGAQIRFRNIFIQHKAYSLCQSV